MAKVEMSLNEYNAIKEELDFLKRVIKEITTPVVDEWSKEYYGDRRSEHSLSNQVTDEVKAYLNAQVMNHIPEDYIKGDILVDADFSSCSILKVSYIEVTEESCEEDC